MLTFPATWWTPGSPLIIAHRGASRAAPENTLAAFRLAADLGADGVELDVRLSADGIPVVIHDADVRMTTAGTGLVRTMTLAQIKSLDAGVHFGPQFAGERIPTLEEVLAALDDRLLINIEIKYQPHILQLVTAVAAVVQRAEHRKRIWFSSFRPYALHAIRRLLPQFPCGLLYCAADLGTPLFAPFTPHEAVHPHAPLVRPRSIARAHRQGRRVVTWTVDEPAQARQLAAWGVDVLITNEPARLLAALRG